MRQEQAFMGQGGIGIDIRNYSKKSRSEDSYDLIASALFHSSPNHVRAMLLCTFPSR